MPNPLCSQPALRDELLKMLDADQQSRRHVLERPGDKEALISLVTQDRVRTKRVLAILADRGWPTREEIGLEGDGAIWAILQHSGPAVLKSEVPLMEDAARRGDLDWGLVATSIDRVRVNDGKKQLYGTQFEEKGGTLVPCPIEDEARLDERRAEMGLGPYAEYRALLRRTHENPAKKGGS